MMNLLSKLTTNSTDKTFVDNLNRDWREIMRIVTINTVLETRKDQNRELTPIKKKSIKHNGPFRWLRLALISLLIIWLLFNVIGYIDSDRDEDNSLLFNIWERKRKRRDTNLLCSGTHWRRNVLATSFLLHSSSKQIEREINYCQRSGCDPSRYAFCPRFIYYIQILYL